MTFLFLLLLFLTDWDTATYIERLGFPIAAAVGVGAVLLLFIRAQQAQQSKLLAFIMDENTNKFNSLAASLKENTEETRELAHSINNLVSVLEKRSQPIQRNQRQTA